MVALGSKRSLPALVETGVPYILGFGRSRPMRRRLAALSPHQWRWLKDGGVVETIQEPRAFRAEHVDGLGSFVQHGPRLLLTPLHSDGEQSYRLPWIQLVVQVAA